jgi:hypothetical protein
MNKGTGRRVLLVDGKRHDDKDRRHLMRPIAEAKRITRRLWASPGVLDQGYTSQCVIYACDKWMTTRPITNKGFLTAEERERIYREVQALDEWAQEPHEGTSVRAMYKWLKARGFVSGYNWSFTCEPVIDHVLAVGPVEMGTIWDGGLSEPDKYGYIASTKDTADDEGHAWTIIGADRERVHPKTKEVGAVRMVNSWGTSWGESGRAWLTFSELNKLIALEGEAAVASEIKVAGLDLTSMVA